MKIQACNTCGGNCMGCFYSDECNNWNDIAPYNEAEIEVDTALMELCKGRHSTPATDGAIFETELNPLNVSALESEAKEKLANLNITKLKPWNANDNSVMECIIQVYCQTTEIDHEEVRYLWGNYLKKGILDFPTAMKMARKRIA